MNSMTEAGFERTIVNRRVFLGGLVAGAAGLLIPERRVWALDATMLGRGDDLSHYFTEPIDVRYPEVMSRRGTPGADGWFRPMRGSYYFDTTEKVLYVTTEQGMWKLL